MNIQEQLHAERMRAYATRYRKAMYRAPEPPRQPETVWDDIGSTFKVAGKPRRRVRATGGGPSTVWFNRARGGGNLERMIFG